MRAGSERYASCGAGGGVGWGRRGEGGVIHSVVGRAVEGWVGVDTEWHMLSWGVICYGVSYAVMGAMRWCRTRSGSL